MAGVTARYVGSGPYCYANSLTMVLGDSAEPGLIEVLTGSPFGLELIASNVALFEHGRPERVPPGSLGGADAAYALADIVDQGLPPDQRGGLILVRRPRGCSSPRRCRALARPNRARRGQRGCGNTEPTRWKPEHPLVTGDDATAAALLRELAPTYEAFAEALKS